MLSVIATWFGPELWIALTEITVAAGIDALLTVALILMGRLAIPFSWRKVFQFLGTNVAPYAAALILGAVLTRYMPELREEYLIAATGVAAWLARDWRAKFTVLIGVKSPETLQKDQRPAA